MTKIKVLPSLLLTFIALTTIGCIKVKSFTTDELKWFLPYNRLDSLIFISNKGELDTIVFYKKVASSDTVRSLERGFYNVNYLTVPYKMTEGSYHQFALMGNGQGRYDQNIFSLLKQSDGFIQFEITFLGTIFNGKELKNIKQIDNNEYYFDSKKATYTGMDAEKGKAIKDFTFDIRFGIIKYTDERNIEWKRK